MHAKTYTDLKGYDTLLSSYPHASTWCFKAIGSYQKEFYSRKCEGFNSEFSLTSRQQGPPGNPGADHQAAADPGVPARRRVLPTGPPPGSRGRGTGGGHLAPPELLQGMGKGTVCCTSLALAFPPPQCFGNTPTEWAQLLFRNSTLMFSYFFDFHEISFTFPFSDREFVNKWSFPESVKPSKGRYWLGATIISSIPYIGKVW